MVQVLHGYGIILIKNEMIVYGLVFRDIELCLDIVFKTIVVSVQVIFGDVGQHRHIRPEGFDVV